MTSFVKRPLLRTRERAPEELEVFRRQSRFVSQGVSKNAVNLHHIHHGSMSRHAVVTSVFYIHRLPHG